ncbi:MAG: hypothetical protein J5533_03780, partial [Bacteroidales bacterium]|nr:hypothetical protein [Bacteroidales bacterium]
MRYNAKIADIFHTRKDTSFLALLKIRLPLLARAEVAGTACAVVTVTASKSADAFLLVREYMLAAITPSIMQTMPVLVPPIEKSGEHT